MQEGDIGNDYQELVQKLNGIEYPVRIGKELIALAKASGLVIVYGSSDDLMEFDGAVCDEVGCYDGGFAYLSGLGMLRNECDNDNCPHFERLKVNCSTVIRACWCEEGEYSWTYETSIPHETFEVVAGEEKYCRGIVFALADIENK